MKAKTLLSRMNFAMAAFVLAVGFVMLLTGCGTTGDDNDSSAHDHSAGQGPCH